MAQTGSRLSELKTATADEGKGSETKDQESENEKAFHATKPVFDKDAFMERLSHDYEMAIEILITYKDHVIGTISSLKNHFNQGNIEGLVTDAHSIKGSSGNCGCMAVSEIANHIEKAGQSGDLEEINRLLPELEKYHELSSIEIQKHFSI